MLLSKPSLNHNSGLNVYSSTGMAGLAYAYTAMLRNYTEGYKLGKLAVALNKSPKLVGEISIVVASHVCVFKEPIQALLPTILENYKIALEVRQFDYVSLKCQSSYFSNVTTLIDNRIGCCIWRIWRQD